MHHNFCKRPGRALPINKRRLKGILGLTGGKAKQFAIDDPDPRPLKRGFKLLPQGSDAVIILDHEDNFVRCFKGKEALSRARQEVKNLEFFARK